MNYVRSLILTSLIQTSFSLATQEMYIPYDPLERHFGLCNDIIREFTFRPNTPIANVNNKNYRQILERETQEIEALEYIIRCHHSGYLLLSETSIDLLAKANFIFIVTNQKECSTELVRFFLNKRIIPSNIDEMIYKMLFWDYTVPFFPNLQKQHEKTARINAFISHLRNVYQLEAILLKYRRRIENIFIAYQQSR